VMLKSYDKILHTLKQQKRIKLADFGCAFGQDIRQLILDGVSPDMITAVDLHDGYWKCGKDVFMDNAGDKLNGIKTCWFDMSLPLHHPDALESKLPNQIASYDFILLQAVLHTMSIEQHRVALCRIQMLLKKGGVVMGRTVGSDPEKEWVMTPDGKGRRFLHSATSLSSLFKECGFATWECNFDSNRWDPSTGRAGGGSGREDSGVAGNKLVEFCAVV